MKITPRHLTSALAPLLALSLLASCASPPPLPIPEPIQETGRILNPLDQPYGHTDPVTSPHIINVSEYDPKQMDKTGGPEFSEWNIRPIVDLGAKALIIKSSDGVEIDPKFPIFLENADKQPLLLGAYHMIKPTPSGATQANYYLDRLQKIRQIKKDQGKPIQAPRILLVGDIHNTTQPETVVDFVETIRARAGVYPVLYPENGTSKDGVHQPTWIENTLPQASASVKQVIRKCPLWIAIYRPYSSNQTPTTKMKSYGTWNTWSIWQYGGVLWEPISGHRNGGIGVPVVYQHKNWEASTYFGEDWNPSKTIYQPLERNVFRGTDAELNTFWTEHSWDWVNR